MVNRSEMPNLSVHPTPLSRLIDTLFSRVAGFADSRELGDLDHDDRQIPGLVCAQLTRLLERLILESQSQHGLADENARTLSSIFEVLEALTLRGSAEVQNTIVTEVFENLNDPGARDAVVARLGPSSKALYSRWIGLQDRLG